MKVQKLTLPQQLLTGLSFVALFTPWVFRVRLPGIRASVCVSADDFFDFLDETGPSVGSHVE